MTDAAERIRGAIQRISEREEDEEGLSLSFPNTSAGRLMRSCLRHGMSEHDVCEAIYDAANYGLSEAAIDEIMENFDT